MRPSKNNTSIKYEDDLHVNKIIQASWNTFKPTYTRAHFFTLILLYKYNILERVLVENIIPRNVIINRGAFYYTEHYSFIF